MKMEAVLNGRDPTGGFLVARRRTDDRKFSVGHTVNLVWAPDGGRTRIAGGRWQILSATQFVIAAPGDLIELDPPRHGEGRINILGASPAMVRDISNELRAVSRSGLRKLSTSRAMMANIRSVISEQPGCLSPLLQDLDQAAALGLQDANWLLRHVRLVWERLIFGGALDSPRPRLGVAHPKRVRHRGVLKARLTKVRRMLEDNYDQPINLGEMAASACVSRYHFLREFRKNYGRTPYQLLLKIRLEAARQMIEEESTPINEISRRVGFSSPDGFYRAFRKRFSRSPSQCRFAT